MTREPELAARAALAATPTTSPAAARDGDADALAGALDATGDELGRWIKKAEVYRLGLADAAARANKAEAQRDQAWRNLDTAREDIAAILRATGLGDYARPISTHDVIRGELLPWIESRAALVVPREALRTAAEKARDLIANYLWNEDDSGDENDLHAAYDTLRHVLGPTTEEGLGQTLAALSAPATTETTE